MPRACGEFYGLADCKSAIQQTASLRYLGGGTDALPRRRSAIGGAFSLIEIVITVALLSFIVLGLLAMFQQTQRAFRTSMTQTDVLEAGRISTDLLGREVEQMTSSRLPFSTNFFVRLSPLRSTPLIQGLPGSSDNRTNTVQDFFFVSQLNQDWTGIGYAVLPDYADAGVGSLYRFSVTTNQNWVPYFSGWFTRALGAASQNLTNGLPVTNIYPVAVSRIADGLVHLRVRPYATNGFPIVARAISTNGLFLVTTSGIPVRPLRYTNIVNTACFNSSMPEVANCYFTSNALPAYLELELGILEPQVLQRYKSIGSNFPVIQRQFLSNHVAQVHLFRRRIPVPNIDLSAYQ